MVRIRDICMPNNFACRLIKARIREISMLDNNVRIKEISTSDN